MADFTIEYAVLDQLTLSMTFYDLYIQFTVMVVWVVERWHVRTYLFGFITLSMHIRTVWSMCILRFLWTITTRSTWTAVRHYSSCDDNNVIIGASRDVRTLSNHSLCSSNDYCSGIYSRRKWKLTSMLLVLIEVHIIGCAFFSSVFYFFIFIRAYKVASIRLIAMPIVVEFSSRFSSLRIVQNINLSTAKHIALLLLHMCKLICTLNGFLMPACCGKCTLRQRFITCNAPLFMACAIVGTTDPAANACL